MSTPFRNLNGSITEVAADNSIWLHNSWWSYWFWPWRKRRLGKYPTSWSDTSATPAAAAPPEGGEND